jgi:hypothetical protein
LGATLTEEPFRVLLMEFLNVVLGRSPGNVRVRGSSAYFWDVELKKAAVKDFLVRLF